MHGVRLLAGCLFLAACSGTSNPATTPAFVPTTTTATSTTTTMETTTTLDRVAEIEAIYQDLEYRRLDALYRGDEEAYRAVHIDNGYLERSMTLFETLEFDQHRSRLLRFSSSFTTVPSASQWNESSTCQTWTTSLAQEYLN